MRFKHHLWSERGIRHEPQLIAYIGQKQYHALRNIENMDRYAVQDTNSGERFMDVKLIQVQKESYLHVVEQ